MSQWWTGIPAAQATVSCGGYTHTLRWEAGELIAIDHGDPEQEAKVAGQPIPCFELLRAWSRRRDDPHVLTLASRGPTDPLNIDVDRLRFDYSGPRRQTEQQTLRLLAAGGRLPDRLQATTAAIWARRLRTGHAALERGSTSRCRSAGWPTSGCEDLRSPSTGSASRPKRPMDQPGPCTPSAPTSPTSPS